MSVTLFYKKIIMLIKRLQFAIEIKLKPQASPKHCDFSPLHSPVFAETHEHHLWFGGLLERELWQKHLHV